jgi:hypothetical protein
VGRHRCQSFNPFRAEKAFASEGLLQSRQINQTFNPSRTEKAFAPLATQFLAQPISLLLLRFWHREPKLYAFKQNFLDFGLERMKAISGKQFTFGNRSGNLTLALVCQKL